MKYLFALALFALPLLGSSQLPNGSVAPDFSITDIDGVEHHLYSYLDSGYAVIIDFSATWCGPWCAFFGENRKAVSVSVTPVAAHVSNLCREGAAAKTGHTSCEGARGRQLGVVHEE